MLRKERKRRGKDVPASSAIGREILHLYLGDVFQTEIARETGVVDTLAITFMGEILIAVLGFTLCDELFLWSGGVEAGQSVCYAWVLRVVITSGRAYGVEETVVGLYG